MISNDELSCSVAEFIMIAEHSIATQCNAKKSKVLGVL